jgi:DNA-binding transcriptional regulator YhcF (GntR family)
MIKGATTTARPLSVHHPTEEETTMDTIKQERLTMCDDLIVDIALTPVKNPVAKIVLLALATYANGKGECFPSRERLSNDTFIPVRSLVRALQWLEANGFIKIVQRHGTSNFYVITAMEEDMTDDTRANLAHEVDSNITKIDFTKSNIANTTTTSRANLAHPLDTPMFQAFWHAYPRRVGKGAARAAFKKALKYADGDTIIQGALHYAKHCEQQGTDKQYIPHASTWLNGERWEDDLESEVTPLKKTGSFLDEL